MLVDPNYAENSVKAALQMLRRLHEFNRKIIKKNITKFGMDNSLGQAKGVVKDMGLVQGCDYTYYDSGVNLTACVEGQFLSITE